MCGTIRRIRRKECGMVSQLKFNKTMAVQALLYGCETCAVSKNYEISIQTAEIKLFLSIKCFIKRHQLVNVLFARSLAFVP